MRSPDSSTNPSGLNYSRSLSGLVLKPFTLAMVDDVHLAVLNDKAYLEFSENAATFWTKPLADMWIEREIGLGSRLYAVFLNRKRAGSITLRKTEPSLIDVSFLIYPFAAGRGLATEILMSCTRITKFSEEVKTIQIGCSRGNSAMIRAALKAGLIRISDQSDSVQTFQFRNSGGTQFLANKF